MPKAPTPDGERPDFTPDRETLEAIAGAMRAEVRSFWHVADLVTDAVDDAMERWPSLQRLARAAVLQAIATHAGVSVAYCRQLDAVGRAFLPSHPARQLAALQLCRALVQAAARLHKPPSALFDELQRDARLKLDIVQRLGRQRVDSPARLKAACLRCQARIVVSCPGRGGVSIKCPVCLTALGSRAGAPVLGMLE